MANNLGVIVGVGATVKTTDTANVHTPHVNVDACALASGAATAAKQPALGTAGTPSADVLTVQGASGGTTIPVTAQAGTSEIGRINIKHVMAAGSAMVRPANTTSYTANDSISDNATAGNVTPNVVTISDTNDDPVNLTQVLLQSTDTALGVAAATIRLHLFDNNPTASSGVVGGDNAAWSNKQAGWVGSFSGQMVPFSDGSRGVLVPDGPPVLAVSPASGARTLWWQLQTLSAFTPSGNSTTFTPKFRGYQGRA
jgi:hypothetical protein